MFQLHSGALALRCLRHAARRLTSQVTGSEAWCQGLVAAQLSIRTLQADPFVFVCSHMEYCRQTAALSPCNMQKRSLPCVNTYSDVVTLGITARQPPQQAI